MEVCTVEKGEETGFKEGWQSGISIAVGYFPIALTFGLLSKSSGLSFIETISMSMFVFAGAAQYISLNLLTLGTGSMEIILATFILNIRHFLMAASMQKKTEDSQTWKKLIYSFGITDETFSVAAMRKGTLSAGFMIGLGGIAYASWVLNSGLGYVFGSSLPNVLQESMGIALYAMFIALLMPPFSKSRKVMLLAILSASLNSVFILLGWLSTGWSIIVSVIVASLIIEAIYTKLLARRRMR